MVRALATLSENNLSHGNTVVDWVWWQKWGEGEELTGDPQGDVCNTDHICALQHVSSSWDSQLDHGCRSRMVEPRNGQQVSKCGVQKKRSK